jgi:putative nucleotidyltransferase with HDIG domain
MRVLLVDPHLESSTALSSRFTAERFEKVSLARTGEEAMRVLSDGLANRQPVDLLFLSLDLPDRPGLETYNEVRNVFDLALVLVANREDRHLAIECVGHGADDYIVRPVNGDLALLKAEKLLTKRFMRKELRRSTARNETLFLNILAVMAKVLEAKDPYTRFHSQKVSTLASAIAREMGFQDDEIRRIGIAGILHDIGKLGIREAILLKPGPLDQTEREMVERHAIVASTILEPIEQLQSAVSYIKHHHERFDGAGYPDGLGGDEIPLGARIIHVAEAFDAMVSKRSYNIPKTPDEALAELRRCSGSQFDPQVVSAAGVVLRRDGVLAAPTPAAAARALPDLLQDLTGTVSLKDA